MVERAVVDGAVVDRAVEVAAVGAALDVVAWHVDMTAANVGNRFVGASAVAALNGRHLTPFADRGHNANGAL